jgi:hypothetical protein
LLPNLLSPHNYLLFKFTALINNYYGNPAAVGVPANSFYKIIYFQKIILYLLVSQNYHTEFLTGTICNWEHLLKGDEYKQIVIDSFNWLAKNKKCIICFAESFSPALENF